MYHLQDLESDTYSQLEEKVKNLDFNNLTNNQLLTVMLGNSFNPVGKKRIIADTISIIKQSQGEIEKLYDLFFINGLDTQHAATIIVSLELTRRYFFPKKKTIETPNDVYKYLLTSYVSCQEENFLSISINSAQEIISIKEISKGSVNKAIIRPREIFAQALIDRATTIIVAHNHPSGNVLPSPEDYELTKQIFDAGRLVGVPLLDHIVFSKENFFSFRESGKMKEFL